ncbi:PLD nuclease N-terminal domain-containing protein [Mollicutes bacterium LVI A0078]|nr:PLD nuclease N-terminal domain-containing protein [Mollicutes bacterium LVI A0075]WOO91391.1 PLD nuclease N-terminal domain-containing protein [Mollicutes bacterium LVI A0078]
METTELLLMLLPIILIQLTLMIVAVIHILRHDNFKVGNKALWLIIVIFINLIGPILYFAIGRGE